ncbi:MAG: YggS family pyridoxal phosphate-dependent enzyme [Clostridia bacterium]|nr:YggS family pyridoxal phosphate-dependent enzyme [Clostridia bacterium]
MPDDERYNDIEQNINEVREKISQAAVRAGRNPDDIHLMAVTKTVESRYINHAISCGIDLIGENKVQEFLSKEPELNLQNCKAHLIGHLQSNKTKKIVGKVDVIQSVDSVSLANEIAKRSLEKDIVSKILLEINVGNEESKFGFDYDEIYERVCEISEIEGISVQGFMCVAPICDDKKVLRHIFSNMYRSYLDIASKKINNVNMNVLSMGMSGDYCEAVLEGANLVRVGSAIFGSRNYR